MNKTAILIGLLTIVIVVAGLGLYLSSMPTPAPITTGDGQGTYATPAVDTPTYATPAADAPIYATPAAGTPAASVKEFTVTGRSFSFTPSAMTVKKGDTVRIIFKNENGMHDWRVDEFNAATKVIQGGQEETITFVANKAGSFEYYCSVGNHRAQGMKGTLTVTE